MLSLPHDTIKLELRDLGTLEGFLGEGVADRILRRTLPESLDELLVDRLLDVDTRTSTAALSMVEVDTEVDPVDSLLNVGIGEDNVRALASKLEGDLLQVGASGSLHDLTTDNGGASEGNFVNVHMGGHSRTSDLTEARDDVDDTWWEAGLLDECAGNERG